MGYPTDYPTQPGAFWSTLYVYALGLLTYCLVMRLQISIVVSYLKRYGFLFLNFSLRQYLKVAALRRGFNRNLSKDISLRKNVKSRQKISDPNSTRAGSFLLFLRYIDNIPDCLLWREQLQWGVSFMCAGGFCHLSASHSDCSLFFALSGRRLPFLFPLLFSFPFGLFPLLSPYFFPFSVSPIFRANNLSWSHR